MINMTTTLTWHMLPGRWARNHPSRRGILDSRFFLILGDRGLWHSIETPDSLLISHLVHAHAKIDRLKEGNSMKLQSTAPFLHDNDSATTFGGEISSFTIKMDVYALGSLQSPDIPKPVQHEHNCISRSPECSSPSISIT